MGNYESCLPSKNPKNQDYEKMKKVPNHEKMKNVPPPPTTPNNMEMQNFKNDKRIWRFHNFTHVHQKSRSYHVCFFTPLLTITIKI